MSPVVTGHRLPRQSVGTPGQWVDTPKPSHRNTRVGENRPYPPPASNAAACLPRAASPNVPTPAK